MSGQRRHPHGTGDGGGGAAGAGAAGRGHRQCDDRVPLAAAHSLPPPHARHRPGRQDEPRQENSLLGSVLRIHSVGDRDAPEEMTTSLSGLKL